MSTLTEDRRRAIDQSGWGEAFHLVQPHNLAFWVYCLLVTAGVVVISGQVSIVAAAYSGALTSAIIAFGLLAVRMCGSSVPRIATRPFRASSRPPASSEAASARSRPRPARQ